MHTEYFILKVEIKHYNVMIEGRNHFDQPVKINIRTYDNIGKFTTRQEDYYTTLCLLNYPCFKNYCKMIAIKFD